MRHGWGSGACLRFGLDHRPAAALLENRPQLDCRHVIQAALERRSMHLEHGHDLVGGHIEAHREAIRHLGRTPIGGNSVNHNTICTSHDLPSSPTCSIDSPSPCARSYPLTASYLPLDETIIGQPHKNSAVQVQVRTELEDEIVKYVTPLEVLNKLGGGAGSGRLRCPPLADATTGGER